MRLIRPETAADKTAIEELLDDSFGSDRKERLTVYRLRENIPPIADLCFVLEHDRIFVASLRFWPVRIGEAETPAILLGPIAVARDYRNEGFGLRLIRHGLLQARIEGFERVVLVGDQPYFERVGFERKLAADLDLPGPYDRRRLLARELYPGAMAGVSGMVHAWPDYDSGR